ncbi:hypothetical protein SD80_030140 [Scytonema tolypothrichoides VB-61278]|nr:hypothetical protein SD80_030140 [Scytonema tolypothrichoides VB-61278]
MTQQGSYRVFSHPANATGCNASGLAHKNLEEAVIQFIKGFEIDKILKNEIGLTIITSDLTGKANEAIMYYKKALAIASLLGGAQLALSVALRRNRISKASYAAVLAFSGNV